MIHIHPVTHLLREVTPLGGVHHHVLTTLAVIVFYRDIFLGFFIVDICLGNTQVFLHTQLDRQSVGIPSGLSVHLITLHGLIAVESIFDGTRQHVVNTGVTVSRWRSLIEYELGASFALGYRTVEQIFLIPLLENLIVRLS